MINRQAQSITGMYSSILIHPFLCKAGLIPASILLDYCQTVYAHRLLSLPELHPTKVILPISLRKEDGGFQPGLLPENTLLWMQSLRPKLYGQWLAWQIAINHSIDSAEGVEPVEKMLSNGVKANVIIKSKKKH